MKIRYIEHYGNISLEIFKRSKYTGLVLDTITFVWYKNQYAVCPVAFDNTEIIKLI